MSPAETTARPVGVVIIAIFLMALSGLPIAFTLLGLLIELIKYGPAVLLTVLWPCFNFL